MGTATKSRQISSKAAAPKAKAVRKPKARPADDCEAFERDALATLERPERSSPCMAEVDDDVLEFIAAIDRFKLEHGRPFPSWSEILLIVRQLGYTRG